MDNTNNKKRTRSNSPTTTTEEEERYQKRLKLVPVLADTSTDKKNKKNKRRKNVYFLRSLFIHLAIDGADGDEENNAEIFAADDEVYDKADEFDNVYFLEQLERARENAEKSSQLMKPSIFHANLKQGEFFSMVPPQPQVSDQDRNEWSERPYDYMNLLANTEYTFFFQLRKIPRMCSRLLQNTETGAFLVCDKMDMELKLQNKNNYPIRVMLAVYNPHPVIPSDEDESDEEDDNDNDNTEAEGEESGEEEEEYLLEGEVKSIYPKESLTISSVETDFVRVPPGKTEMITILASQFGHLKDGERSQLMLIVIDDREGDTIRSVAERIQALHFPLDMSAKYALCDTGASITNFIFEKFTKRRNN